MRSAIYSAIATVCTTGAIAVPLSAAEAPAAPVTFWNKLGIPQGCNKIKDAKLNRKGNHPERERKPPLKRLADPENLQSENSSIKAAAKIKAEEDLAPQKIKAIKYLATIGCDCYPGVGQALLDALSDCTESVRYEAALALVQVAGDHCNRCDKSCCNANIMNKLNEMANGQDDQGCYKESSPRVRAAAKSALDACRRKFPPSLMPSKEVPQKEVPLQEFQPHPAKKEVPTPPSTPGPQIPLEPGSSPPLPAPQSAPLPPSARQGHASPNGLVDLTAFTREEVNPETLMAADRKGEVPEGKQPVLYRLASDQCIPSVPPCPTPAPPHAPPGEITRPAPSPEVAPERIPPKEVPGVKPGEAPGEAAAEAPEAPYPSGLASTYGAVSGPQSFATNMIGDQFGHYNLYYIYFPPYPPEEIPNIPSPGSGGAVGRLKIAENTSPIPRDRFLFDYSYFDGVPLTANGVDVNRFTPGFEKTFFHGWMSLEMKIPMATTLNSTINESGATSTSHAEFGNMAITWKSLMLRRETFAFSGGLMVTVPTADNVRVVSTDGTPMVEILNRSTHLGPFVGFLWTPNDRFFAQGFFQWDVASNGNPVLVEDQIQPEPGLQTIGKLTDTTFQYVDLGIGYWAYRGNERFRHLTGLAYTAEVHWNHSLQDTDVISGNNWRIGDLASNIETVNLTLGAHLEFNNLTTLTAAYVVPLGGGLDREFNGEFRLMLNRRFGPQSRLTRTPSTF